LFTNPVYTRTDSIKSLIKKHGNTLTYDLVSLTPGAVLEPVTPEGTNMDGDIDGISDVQEKGPYGNDDTFDGNADGTPDFEQANVSSFHTFDGLNYVTLVVPEGTELSQLLVTDNPSPSDVPEDTEFNYGFFDFSIEGKTMQKEVIHVYDGNQEFIIRTDNLPSGLYLITLSGNNYSYKSRFIKLE